MKKVLLTTVCGPFGVNTDDCTEHIMPELFHAQVTRSQGIFSVRSTYISYGLEYIAQNIKTPTTVLQYPTMRQFNLPNHVALIPDGNRRWAKENNLPTFEGHKKGYQRTIEIGRRARKMGIKVLTLWAFST